MYDSRHTNCYTAVIRVYGGRRTVVLWPWYGQDYIRKLRPINKKGETDTPERAYGYTVRSIPIHQKEHITT